MIPVVNDDFTNDFEYDEEISRTFKLDIDMNSIRGNIDDLEAVKQSIYLILSIERYRHIIYSWNYGVELEDLFGMPVSYVLPELKRRISDALLQDTRIQGVSDFVFNVDKSKVAVSFKVGTIFGELQVEKVVSI